MAKSKTGPALFDLIDDSDGFTGIQGQSLPRPLRKDTTGVLAQQQVLDVPIRPDKPRRTAPKTVGAKPPIMAIDDDRLVISLGTVQAGLALFALLILVVASYEIGRQGGVASGIKEGYVAGRQSFEAGAISDIESARAAPPQSELVSPLLAEGGGLVEPGRNERVRTPRWIPGHTYVVIQNFGSGHQADAERARDFLADYGIESVIVGEEDAGQKLVTATGFDRRDAAQRKLSDSQLERVQQAGKDFFASGGKYRLEGYLDTFKAGEW